MKSFLAIVFAAVTIFSHTAFAQTASDPQTTSAGWQRLSSEELGKFFPGSLHATNDRGQVYTLQTLPDGSAKAESTRYNAPGMIYNDGTWRVKEKLICVKLETWQDGKENCHGIEQLGDKYRYADDRRPITLGR